MESAHPALPLAAIQLVTCASIVLPPVLVLCRLLEPSSRLWLTGLSLLAAWVAVFASLRLRRWEYAPLPWLVVCVAGHPVTHLLHLGSALVMALELGVEPDAGVTLGAVFSFAFVWLRENELRIPLLPIKRRIALQTHVPRALLAGAALGAAVALAFPASPALAIVVVSVALAFSAKLCTLVAMESHGPQAEEAYALLKSDNGSIEQALLALPLFPAAAAALMASRSPPPRLLTLGLESALVSTDAAQAHVRAWWKVRLEQAGLMQREKDRLAAVLQAVYAAEARVVGSAFARRGPRMGVLSELARARAVCGAPSAADWMQAVDACASLVTAQSVVLMVFVKQCNQSPEVPVDENTGMRDRAFALPAGNSKKEIEAADWEAQDRALAWRERAWLGKAWRLRLVFGDFVWELDPVYEEAKRRRVKGREALMDMASASRLAAMWQRDVEAALLADLSVVERASESLALIARARKDVAVFDLARQVLERCFDACCAAERVLLGSTVGRRPSHGRLFKQLAFCLERDLAVLGRRVG